MTQEKLHELQELIEFNDLFMNWNELHDFNKLNEWKIEWSTRINELSEIHWVNWIKWIEWVKWISWVWCIASDDINEWDASNALDAFNELKDKMNWLSWMD